MRNYEDKIYSLGENVMGQTQAILSAAQTTIGQPESRELVWEWQSAEIL